MDHYKVLGVHKNASKEEIKQAFRKLAMEFHPDKHSHSPKHLKDSATFKFKQLSEAYETLTDDRKRADYNFRSRYQNSYANSYSGQHNYSNYYGSNYSRYGDFYGTGYGFSGSANRGGGSNFSLKLEIFFRFLTTRSFVLNAALFGILLGGMYGVNAGGEALWKMQNPGKSFEEAVESIEKAKAVRDDA